MKLSISTGTVKLSLHPRSYTRQPASCHGCSAGSFLALTTTVQILGMKQEVLTFVKMHIYTLELVKLVR